MATPTDPWTREPLPAIRRETLAGGRIVRCFVERPRSLFGLFDRAARTRPEHDALVCQGRRWRYREAAGDIERIAAGLAALGLERGDRVAMLVGNRPEF